jgi:hypothetical protein
MRKFALSPVKASGAATCHRFNACSLTLRAHEGLRVKKSNSAHSVNSVKKNPRQSQQSVDKTTILLPNIRLKILEPIQKSCLSDY